MQAKLLACVAREEVRPVGSNDKVNVDVRVIAATNRDLEAAYRAGRFARICYFRLNVVTIHLPALRDRQSDILCWCITSWTGMPEARIYKSPRQR